MDIVEIKKTLRIIGMTYAELSEKSGVPLATLKNIFCGRTPNPHKFTVQAIEKALDLEKDTLNDSLSARYITTDEEYILRTFRSLSARDKELFLGVVGNFDRPVSELKNNRKHKA